MSLVNPFAFVYSIILAHINIQFFILEKVVVPLCCLNSTVPCLVYDWKFIFTYLLVKMLMKLLIEVASFILLIASVLFVAIEVSDLQ